MAHFQAILLLVLGSFSTGFVRFRQGGFLLATPALPSPSITGLDFVFLLVIVRKKI